MTRPRDGLTAEQWAAVAEALPELRQLARRLRRRCPHKTVDELEALASDALMSRAPRWDPAKGRLFDFARRYLPQDVVRAAYAEEGDVALRTALRAMEAHAETITVLDTASRWAESTEEKDARARALGRNAVLAGRYAYSGVRAAESPEDEYGSREAFEAMKRAASAADPRAPALLDLLYARELTWEETATELGLDVRQAQRIEASVISQLRRVLTAETPAL